MGLFIAPLSECKAATGFWETATPKSTWFSAEEFKKRKLFKFGLKTVPGSVKDISKWELGKWSWLATEGFVNTNDCHYLILNIKQSDLTMCHQFKHLVVLTTFQAFVKKLKTEEIRCLAPQGWWFLTTAFIRTIRTGFSQWTPGICSLWKNYNLSIWKRPLVYSSAF